MRDRNPREHSGISRQRDPACRQDEPHLGRAPRRRGVAGDRRAGTGRILSRLRDSLGKSRRALTEQARPRRLRPCRRGGVGAARDCAHPGRCRRAGDRGARAKARGPWCDRQPRGRTGRRGAGALGEPPVLEVRGGPPSVVLVVGVNGTGKTTTIGKLAHQLRRHGRSVLLGAADTFRAAAEEQLEIWATRAEADFVGGSAGATRPRSRSTRSKPGVRAARTSSWSTRPVACTRSRT